LGTVYKGWNAKILVCPKLGESGACSIEADWEEIGCCESVSVDITANVDSYYFIGNKDPYALMPGNLEITGSLSKAWVHTKLLQILIRAPGAIEKFNLIFRAGTDTGAPWIKLTNCRLESGTIDIPQDGWLMEDYDFRAESIEVGESPMAGDDWDPPETYRMNALKNEKKTLAKAWLLKKEPKKSRTKKK